MGGATVSQYGAVASGADGGSKADPQVSPFQFGGCACMVAALGRFIFASV